MVDYKTGRIDESKLEQKTEYYQPQLEAYALMVAAFDDSRPVTTSLFFTEIEANTDVEFSTESGDGSLGELKSSLDRRLREEIEAQTQAEFDTEGRTPESDR